MIEFLLEEIVYEPVADADAAAIARWVQVRQRPDTLILTNPWQAVKRSFAGTQAFSLSALV